MKLYDLSLLEDLRDERQLLEIIHLFLEHTPLMIRELSTDVGQRNWKGVVLHTHKLKGSAGVIQAGELTSLLQQMEQQIKSRKSAGVIDELLQTFLSAYSQLEIQLNEECRKIKEDIT